jgi:transposase
MSRRKFNKEFKVAAVKLVLDDELPVSQVAQQLSVHPNSLYRWVNEYEKYGESAFPGNGSTIYNYQAEIHRLERRNQELEEEVELLKKFKVFLRTKSKRAILPVKTK